MVRRNKIPFEEMSGEECELCETKDTDELFGHKLCVRIFDGASRGKSVTDSGIIVNFKEYKTGERLSFWPILMMLEFL